MMEIDDWVAPADEKERQEFMKAFAENLFDVQRIMDEQPVPTKDRMILDENGNVLQLSDCDAWR